MKKMFLIFSHNLSSEQREDAQNSLGVKEFIALDEPLQILWSNIPPEQQSIKASLNPLKDFLKANAKKGDVALIQGDFGASYEMVSFAKQMGLVAVYATTKRIVSEENQDGKIVKKSIFKHELFREYVY